MKNVIPIQSENGKDSGHSRLNELGYKQELKRDLSVLSNFAFSFSIISVLTGITTLYNSGLKFGGPVVLVYGWLVAGAFTMAVGLSMAEICSSYPTSGGLYYWSAKLAGRNWAPFASWITGWYNIVGQATFDCLLKTYGFLTPDFWRETRFSRSPFQEYTDMLAKPTTKAITYVEDVADIPA